MSDMGAWDDPHWKRAHLAVENLDPDELVSALRHAPDLDVNVPGFGGWTLLNYAIDSEVSVPQGLGQAEPYPAVVSLVLLNAGADPLQRHPEGWTSVDLAVRLSHSEFLRALGR